MKPLVSVIVPVFNVEKYVAACFDSILSQGFSSFEVIAIDDGSTDSSGTICDSYAAKDCRFNIVHTKNHGVGNARNLALSLISGKYCFFLDADDLLGKGALDYMYALAEKHSADIVLGTLRRFSLAPPESIENESLFSQVYYGKDDIIEHVLFSYDAIMPLEKRREYQLKHDRFHFCTILYRSEFLLSERINFLTLSYGEDTYFCLWALLKATVAVATNYLAYYYRKNLCSATFKYHDNYLNETKDYYDSYGRLFIDYAPLYYEQAIIGIKATYYLRCVSAIEREIDFGDERKLKEIYSVYREISKDTIFREQLTTEQVKKATKYTSMVLHLILHKTVFVAALLAKTIALGVHAKHILTNREKMV